MKLSVRKSNNSDFEFDFLNLGDIEFKNSKGEYKDERLSLIISEPLESFDSHESQFIKLFHSLIDEFENRVRLFRFDNTHEIFIWKSFWPLFKIIHKVFEERNLLDRLIFTDNNCNFHFKNNKWKYEGYPSMLGFPIAPISDDIESYIKNKKFNKHFLCLNRRPKYHREDIVNFLVESGISENSYYSFGVDGDNENHPLFKKLDFDINLIGIHPASAQDTFTSFQDTTFCYIVTETDADNEYTTTISELDNEIHLNNNLFCHLTEKTSRALSSGMPFIIVSHAGSLKLLKKFGFKTFDKWWDESYDDLLNWDARKFTIQDVITYLNSLSLEKCSEMYKEMIPNLIHNRKLYEEFNKKFEYFNQMDICEIENFKDENEHWLLFRKLKKRWPQ